MTKYLVIILYYNTFNRYINVVYNSPAYHQVFLGHQLWNGGVYQPSISRLMLPLFYWIWGQTGAFIPSLVV